MAPHARAFSASGIGSALAGSAYALHAHGTWSPAHFGDPGRTTDMCRDPSLFQSHILLGSTEGIYCTYEKVSPDPNPSDPVEQLQASKKTQGFSTPTSTNEVCMPIDK
ncbi:hypothetical protein PGT21_000824 [Puccinia graminis f. sp. tritici]|uniref:Uncharacterized protein n=1 Tax=Puccinia graminis f. sp. tritici TaxID=56615 RepID=A0A5B0RWQ9_PUCGR|nr:hypothetical protein PGT21_022327 [Puccinia graminis f. sp. tritici]KAA1106897.1 hypothetical protein PGT21_000824 [Puccinia graminis f. sp. tritici]KAA1129808.1 hypothetical protein PGTUg99_002751 [Puccinia graminis f. sp. tritici]